MYIVGDELFKPLKGDVISGSYHSAQDKHTASSTDCTTGRITQSLTVEIIVAKRSVVLKSALLLLPVLLSLSLAGQSVAHITQCRIAQSFTSQ